MHKGLEMGYKRFYEGKIETGLENEYVECFYDLLAEIHEASDMQWLFYPSELKAIFFNPRGVHISFSYETREMMRVILKCKLDEMTLMASFCFDPRECGYNEKETRLHLSKMLWSLSRRALKEWAKRTDTALDS